MILSGGLLEPCQGLLKVHGDTEALAIHGAELMLAQSVTRLGSDLVRRHRPWVVDRHAFAKAVDVADGRSCEDVALEGEERGWAKW